MTSRTRNSNRGLEIRITDVIDDIHGCNVYIAEVINDIPHVINDIPHVIDDIADVHRRGPRDGARRVLAFRA